MKMDEKTARLLVQLLDRVQTLEAQQIATKEVFEALIHLLGDNKSSRERVIEILQESIWSLETEYEHRLVRERPEWAWQALSAAIPVLTDWFHPYLRTSDDEVH